METEIILIDPGFSSSLAEVVDEPIDGHPLWTARFLHTNREAVLQTHRRAIKGGSKLIRTNSYQAHPDGFVKYLGITLSESLDLIRESVKIVKEAIELEKENILIGGSVGPYGASLHDGSEYTGSYAEKLTLNEFKFWHKPRIEILINEGVDLLIFETIPCSKEAVALISLLKEYPKQKAWVSFSAKDNEHICSGEKFSDVAFSIWNLGLEQLVAVGINCTIPSLITPLFMSVKIKNPNLPLVVYPNSGEIYNTELKKWIDPGNRKHLSEYVHEWLDLGVIFIGGCCRTTMDDLIKINENILIWKQSRL